MKTIAMSVEQVGEAIIAYALKHRLFAENDPVLQIVVNNPKEPGTTITWTITRENP